MFEQINVYFHWFFVLSISGVIWAFAIIRSDPIIIKKLLGLIAVGGLLLAVEVVIASRLLRDVSEVLLLTLIYQQLKLAIAGYILLIGGTGTLLIAMIKSTKKQSD